VLLPLAATTTSLRQLQDGGRNLDRDGDKIVPDADYDFTVAKPVR
jgi:hypothetical protein